MSYQRRPGLSSVLTPAPQPSRCVRAAVYVTAIGVGVVTGCVAVVTAYGRSLFARFTSGRS